jgi:hypothetical protein
MPAAKVANSSFKKHRQLVASCSQQTACAAGRSHMRRCRLWDSTASCNNLA